MEMLRQEEGLAMHWFHFVEEVNCCFAKKRVRKKQCHVKNMICQLDAYLKIWLLCREDADKGDAVSRIHIVMQVKLSEVVCQTLFT
jgi:hypothetical protein